MKIKYLYICSFLILISALKLNAQDAPFFVGANGVYNIPIGTLGDRFKSEAGGMIFAGKQISDDWTWIGKFEYIELENLNRSKLYKKVEVQQNNSTSYYEFPLPKLSMKLQAAGLTAEAKLNLFRTSWAETNVNLGFGFYYWHFTRSAYYDSLFIDTSGTGKLMKVSDLAVPANTQEDWSGAANIGLDINIKLFEPVWLNVGANYKLIVGELWPALALDLENVSGMQFLDIRAGFKINL